MHAQDDERRRVAQTLHETTAQDLAALTMSLARLNRTTSPLSDTDRNAVTESISLAEQSIADIRTLSYLLHPPLLDEMGLVSALRWFAAGFAARSGITLDVGLPKRFERLPLDTETALFESSGVVDQHSPARRERHGADPLAARLPGARPGDQDRGHGIPKASLTHITSRGGVAGVGIAGMSERIEQLGGRLALTSSDRGTTVRVRLPLVKAAN